MHPSYVGFWPGAYAYYPCPYTFIPVYVMQTVYGQPTDAAWECPNLIRPPPSSTSTELAPTSTETGNEVCHGKRIFIARIPSSVSEYEMKKYFEQYGVVEDAYIPRNVKTMARGIGFVTFEDPHAVDVVMDMEHKFGGTKIVVDKAKAREPKNDQEEEARLPAEFVNNDALVEFGSYGSLESGMFDPNCLRCFPALGTYPNSYGNNHGPSSLSNISDEYEASIEMGVCEEAVAATNQALMGLTIRHESETPGNQHQSGEETLGTTTEKKEKITDNSVHVQNVREGHRIFVGKLQKKTVEQDLEDYFSQFGYVLDVYIPRSKRNKKQLRDFGFVTFETETSLKMVVSQPIHCVNGAVLTIDVAFPQKLSH